MGAQSNNWRSVLRSRSVFDRRLLSRKNYLFWSICFLNCLYSMFKRTKIITFRIRSFSSILEPEPQPYLQYGSDFSLNVPAFTFKVTRNKIVSGPGGLNRNVESDTWYTPTLKIFQLVNAWYDRDLLGGPRHSALPLRNLKRAQPFLFFFFGGAGAEPFLRIRLIFCCC